MSRNIFVRPLRDNVPADNGARTFMPMHGMVRQASPYFERLRQIGAAEIRELPKPGQRVMIRPVNGSRVLAGVAEWQESHEAALTDNLIQYPEAAPEQDAEEPVLMERGAHETERSEASPETEDERHG